MTYLYAAGAGSALIAAALVANLALPSVFSTSYAPSTGPVAAAPTPVVPDTRPVVEHVPLPEAVKTLYMTSCVAGTPSLRDRLVALVEETEFNSIIIDIKDYSGTISFPPTSPELAPAWADARCGTADMAALVERLHELGIYTIARITVFQDPYYTTAHPEVAVKRADGVTVWEDHKGLSFVDVGARAYWDYIITLSEETYALGFDELNFDYIRYPSDGNMQDIAFTHSGSASKAENLETFFAYLHDKLSDPERYADVRHVGHGREKAVPYTSADLFGYTTVLKNDLGIGQVQERAMPYFDFIAPMVYPSHYNKGFAGLANPNSDPYRVIYTSMVEAVQRAKATTTSLASFAHERIGTSTPAVYAKPSHDIQKLRPWLQDFDYGGDYGVEEVRAQIQATYDAGLTSWMIWDPANRYTREAYLGE